MGEDRYSRDEVEAILKRSAQIEGERLNSPQEGRLSLSDLEAIAEESGLDPASVRAAGTRTPSRSLMVLSQDSPAGCASRM